MSVSADPVPSATLPDGIAARTIDLRKVYGSGQRCRREEWRKGRDLR